MPVEHTGPDWRRSPAIAARVRANAGSAGLGAACLLFFGFFYLSRASGSGMLYLAWDIAYFTFRIGGALMAAVALLSLTGRFHVLLLDAVVSIPIGVLLLTSAALRAVSGGSALEAFLIGLGGVLFLRDGWRNGIQYMDLLRTQGGADRILDATLQQVAPADSSPPPRPISGEHTRTLVERLRHGETALPATPPSPAAVGRQSAQDPPGNMEADPPRSCPRCRQTSPAYARYCAHCGCDFDPGSEHAAPAEPDVPATPPPQPQSPTPESDPPPDGFLAALARQDPRRTP